MKIVKQLMDIQRELKVNKGQWNSFGKYKYRSLEDITEAVKEVAYKHDCVVMFSNEMVNVGDRYYNKATAILMNTDGERIECTDWAREAESKKGMDESQITGTASSYARKYAAGGLLALDDTKDADTNEFHNQTAEETPRKKLLKYCNEHELNLEQVSKDYGLSKQSSDIDIAKALKDLVSKNGQ